MRLLMLTASYPPSANGVAVSVKSTSEELRRLGHEVYLLVPNTPGLKKNKYLLTYPSVPNPIIKDYPIPLIPITPKIMRTLRKIKFDLVHAHHPFYISFFADTISRFAKAPFVFTYHTRYDKYAEVYAKFISRKIARKLADYSAIKSCKKADLTIAPSQTLKRSLMLKSKGLNIKVVPSGIKFNNPEKRSAVKPSYYLLPKNKKVILSVSRLGKEKNIPLIIKSMKYLPEIYHLVIAGTGVQEKKLIKLTSDLGLSERVQFVGKVEHERIGELYKLADMFLLPSVTETQGLTLMEASYFGLPIVAVKSSVAEEYLPPDAKFLANNNPKDFSEAVLNVARLDKKKIAKIARKWAGKFSIDKTTLELEKTYKELILKNNDQ